MPTGREAKKREIELLNDWVIESLSIGHGSLVMISGTVNQGGIESWSLNHVVIEVADANWRQLKSMIIDPRFNVP